MVLDNNRFCEGNTDMSTRTSPIAIEPLQKHREASITPFYSSVDHQQRLVRKTRGAENSQGSGSSGSTSPEDRNSFQGIASKPIDRLDMHSSTDSLSFEDVFDDYCSSSSSSESEDSQYQQNSSHRCQLVRENSRISSPRSSVHSVTSSVGIDDDEDCDWGWFAST